MAEEMEERVLPNIPRYDRYTALKNYYNYTGGEVRIMYKNPQAVEAYEIVQKLKEPAAAPMFADQKLQKEHLPVPPVDVRQAWANNCLDRFVDRFLISVNDFDDNDRFYVQNDITLLLDGVQNLRKTKRTTLKEDRLQKMQQRRMQLTRQRVSGLPHPEGLRMTSLAPGAAGSTMFDPRLS